MATVTAGLVLWVGVTFAPSPQGSGSVGPGPAGSEPVRSAIERGRFPWYDAGTDRVRPVLPQPDLEGFWKRIGDWFERRFRRLNRWRVPGVGGMGDVLMVGLALLFFTLVLVGLLELLRRYRATGEGAGLGVTIRAGGARWVEGMPAGVRLDAADPWAEAQRLRALGDYAGAVVHLFAHQLLALERVRQLRLVPGRTGRQLVRSVGDRALRATVEPTLRLFEAVYYGHRAPTAEAFEAVWVQAEAFERLLAPRAAEAVP
jgi:hypothetical protein